MPDRKIALHIFLSDIFLFKKLNLFPFAVYYSARNAAIGSRLAARHAG
jgi:hypothetical protein